MFGTQRVLHKFITQNVALSLKRLIIQFKIMCIKSVSVLLCANQKIKPCHHIQHAKLSEG